MRAGPILLLALCQFLVLSLAASGEQEALTIGKYDISFFLQADGSYQIDARQGNDTYQVSINDSGSRALIYVAESPEIGFEGIKEMVDELLAEANASNVEHYIRSIDGQKAVLGVGSRTDDRSPLFTAAYARYFGAEGTGIYVLIGSDFPWEDTTRMLLDTLKVELKSGAGILQGAGSSAEGSEFGVPLSQVNGSPAEPAVSRPSDLVYDGYITYSDNGGRSIEDAIVIENAFAEEDGVAAEYYYLEEKYGLRDVDWSLISQDLVSEEEKFYDLMDIELADKTRIEVYFDITEFFGIY